MEDVPAATVHGYREEGAVDPSGAIRTAISDGLVALLKDLVVCLLRGGFTRVVEDATGRHVVGFMSGNQQDPAQNTLLD